MITIDGRPVLSRADIHEQYGYATSSLERWWAARETNGHPPYLQRIGGTMYWDAEEWERWDHERLNPPQQERDPRLRTRDELGQDHSLSRSKLAELWAARETNGHPQPVVLNGVMHWDTEEWGRWYEQHRATSAYAVRSTVDQDAAAGDPDELIGSAVFGRILGHRDHSWVAKAAVAPPPGFPAPHTWGDPVARKRPKWRRGDAVAYAGAREEIAAAQPVRRRRAGGTNSQPYNYYGDPRLTLARELIGQYPDATQTELIERLHQRSDQPSSVTTWRNILITARDHPED
ncbi:hypothetical protein ABZY68_25255 [Streptomyces sp. NPDC006482]|uniref:hypothetical protein n=1 Tax=Streptomyces sp. NPDC006482 TaxID=3154306 RepID=UPI0033B19CBE